MNHKRIISLCELLESYSNKKVVLKENDENIDDFFKPKNLKSREEKYEKEKQKLLNNLNFGLSKIKSDYENKNWNSEPEKLFLELFSKLHVYEEYDEEYEGYYLENNENKRRCFLDLKYQEIDMSYTYFWQIFKDEFHWDYNEIQSFMKDMLNEHFKLNGFSPEPGTGPWKRRLNEHFKLK